MAALAEFDAALGRIGLEQAQRNAIIETSECMNIAMLGLLLVDQLSKVCKRLETRAVNLIRISTLQEQFYWIIGKQRMQLPVAAEDFTMVVALNQAQTTRQQLEDDARMDKEMVAKAPEKFKTASSWKVFSEAFETYLGQILGSGRIPLRYVIRMAVHADPVAVYLTEQEQSIVLSPLQGIAYQRDNIKVYGIIKQLVLE
jgi:hypothetical protein